MVKYCPSIIKLFGFSFNWAKEDEKFKKKLIERDGYLKREKTDEIKISTSLYDLLLEGEKGDSFSQKFLNFINQLIGKIIIENPQFEKKIRLSLMGTINNLNNWNYLNPIGELACLNKIISTGKYVLKEIECNFDNGSTKDFLFLNRSDQELILEVLNIHSKFYEKIDFEEIKSHLLEKIYSKIKKETKGVDFEKYKHKILFVPVVWHLNIESMRKHYSFFRESNNLNKESELNYKVSGFCSHIIINDQFEFGEITSLIDKINHGA